MPANGIPAKIAKSALRRRCTTFLARSALSAATCRRISTNSIVARSAVATARTRRVDVPRDSADAVAAARPSSPTRPRRSHWGGHFLGRPRPHKRPPVRSPRRVFLLHTLLHKPQKSLVLWAFLGWNPITGIAGCCALARSDHATAPPSRDMNSRRFIIRSPRRRARARPAAQ